MMERRAGSIVATASLAAVSGVPAQAAYTAAKGGVAALTRQIAVDYAGYGIRMNALCPATVVTPLVLEAYEQRGGDVDELLARARARRAARAPRRAARRGESGAVPRERRVSLDDRSRAAASTAA